MSTLTYDGATHTLTLKSDDGTVVGSWHANNNVSRDSSLRGVPDGTYTFIDTDETHTHSASEDSTNGPYGTHGILRIDRFNADGRGHDGVGVHAGRANKNGPDHPTHGCIRTSDDAMGLIADHIADDPLTTLTVQNNPRQLLNTRRHHDTQAGDHHHPAHRRGHGAAHGAAAH